jgi:hypothetical protein
MVLTAHPLRVKQFDDRHRADRRGAGHKPWRTALRVAATHGGLTPNHECNYMFLFIIFKISHFVRFAGQCILASNHSRESTALPVRSTP